MKDTKNLGRKKILIVDDEADVLESLEELLDLYELDKANDYETAENLLKNKSYDAAILDIMGVNGYKLLEITTAKGLPTLILTAHALSPDNFIKAIKGGARAYIPKDKMSEIPVFLQDILEAHRKGGKKLGEWFSRLEKHFEKRFGVNWKEEADPEFWKKYFYI